MKGYNRLEQIMDYLKSHNLVTVDELVAVTNASPGYDSSRPDKTR